jgi:hypothetical protein
MTSVHQVVTVFKLASALDMSHLLLTMSRVVKGTPANMLTEVSASMKEAE